MHLMAVFWDCSKSQLNVSAIQYQLQSLRFSKTEDFDFQFDHTLIKFQNFLEISLHSINLSIILCRKSGIFEVFDHHFDELYFGTYWAFSRFISNRFGVVSEIQFSLEKLWFSKIKKFPELLVSNFNNYALTIHLLKNCLEVPLHFTTKKGNFWSFRSSPWTIFCAFIGLFIKCFPNPRLVL